MGQAQRVKDGENLEWSLQSHAFCRHREHLAVVRHRLNSPAQRLTIGLCSGFNGVRVRLRAACYVSRRMCGATVQRQPWDREGGKRPTLLKGLLPQQTLFRVLALNVEDQNGRDLTR